MKNSNTTKVGQAKGKAISADAGPQAEAQDSQAPQAPEAKPKTWLAIEGAGVPTAEEIQAACAKAKRSAFFTSCALEARLKGAETYGDRSLPFVMPRELWQGAFNALVEQAEKPEGMAEDAFERAKETTKETFSIVFPTDGKVDNSLVKAKALRACFKVSTLLFLAERASVSDFLALEFPGLPAEGCQVSKEKLELLCNLSAIYGFLDGAYFVREGKWVMAKHFRTGKGSGTAKTKETASLSLPETL